MLKNNLPQYWAVENDSNNPNWITVVAYINMIYKTDWKKDNAGKYCGFDGQIRWSKEVRFFDNNPQLITIEDFVSRVEAPKAINDTTDAPIAKKVEASSAVIEKKIETIVVSTPSAHLASTPKEVEIPVAAASKSIDIPVNYDKKSEDTINIVENTLDIKAKKTIDMSDDTKIMSEAEKKFMELMGKPVQNKFPSISIPSVAPKPIEAVVPPVTESIAVKPIEVKTVVPEIPKTAIIEEKTIVAATEVKIEQKPVVSTMIDQNSNISKKIVGYICPSDLFNGEITKGIVYEADASGILYVAKGKVGNYSLPKEIVQSWEAVEEIVAIKLNIGSQNASTVISKGKIELNGNVVTPAELQHIIDTYKTLN